MIREDDDNENKLRNFGEVIYIHYRCVRKKKSTTKHHEHLVKKNTPPP